MKVAIKSDSLNKKTYRCSLKCLFLFINMFAKCSKRNCELQDELEFECGPFKLIKSGDMISPFPPKERLF